IRLPAKAFLTGWCDAIMKRRIVLQALQLWSVPPASFRLGPALMVRRGQCSFALANVTGSFISIWPTTNGRSLKSILMAGELLSIRQCDSVDRVGCSACQRQRRVVISTF